MKPDTYIKQTLIKAPVDRVFSWHAQKGAILRLTPPWAPLKLISRKGIGIDKGVRVVFKIRVFGFSMAWEAEHIDHEPNRLFRDRQIKGPFAFWQHTHRFSPELDGSTRMTDEIEFKLPFGLLGRPFYGFARKELTRMFSYRHRVLKTDLERFDPPSAPKRILISGASGTIGSALVPFLQTCGHEVIRLVRKKDHRASDEIYWDPARQILDINGAGPIDVVINLNGVDISRGRWTRAQKKKILDSRILSTRLLSDTISRLDHKPEVFISASAIGYYGDRADQALTEDTPKGNSFISKVCIDWEDASRGAAVAGIRTVNLRTGVVLTPAGGALQRMATPFKMGVGVVIGHGRQYMSWISMADMVSGILYCMDNQGLEGPVNFTAPHPVTNKEFSHTLARVFKKKVRFTLPAAMARLLWGQMATETLLASARVLPQKLTASGFMFQHETLETALRDMLGMETGEERQGTERPETGR